MSVGANVGLALLVALTLQIPDLRSHYRLPYRESYQLWSFSTYCSILFTDSRLFLAIRSNYPSSAVRHHPFQLGRNASIADIMRNPSRQEILDLLSDRMTCQSQCLHRIRNLCVPRRSACKTETHSSHPPDPLFAIFHAIPFFPCRAPFVLVHQKLGVKAEDETRERLGVLVLVIRMALVFRSLSLCLCLLLGCGQRGQGLYWYRARLRLSPLVSRRSCRGIGAGAVQVQIGDPWLW